MNIKHNLSTLLLGALLVACTSENTLNNLIPPDQGGADDANSREVLLSLKNKLNVIPVTTKAADDPIATTPENHIYTLDVYVFGSKDEAGPYTFQEMFYYREDARDVISEPYATSFTLNAGADNSTALLRMKKGLFVKVYCIANCTRLVDAAGAEFTGFQSLLQSKPGQADNTVTAGIPTEENFLKFHTVDLQATEPTDVLNTPLPMTGAYTTPLDLTDFSVSARTQLGFKLSRMVARFDVENDASQSKFTITSVSLANGRAGASFFPVKPVKNADGNLITYPARDYLAAQTTDSPDGLGIFYVYPSPVEDKGYLILSGTYAANLTDPVPVTYKVPFKPVGVETGNYIEVAYNHRYKVKITDADPYHLDFTLDVDDWTDEGNVDNYKPENNLSFDDLSLSAAGNTNVQLLDDHRIAMKAVTGSTLSFEMKTNSAIKASLQYANDDKWLVADGEPGTTTKASQVTTFKYKLPEEGIADMTCLPVTIRLTNQASGKNLDVIVVPTALTGPEIELVPSEGNSYAPATKTLTIANKADHTVSLKVTSVKLSGDAATTGSSVAIETGSWLSADASSNADAEATYTFTLTAAQAAEATNKITFTSAATNATTEVKVVLAAEAVSTP